MTDPAPPLYDLRSFFKTIGSPLGGAALTAPPGDRADMSKTVELVDECRARIDAPPLQAAGFIDGVQSTLTVTYREHRPVYLTYQAAGAVGAGAQLIGLKERLTLLASVADADWLDTVNTGVPAVPVQQIPAIAPMDVERDAFVAVGDWRDHLEQTLVRELVDAGMGPLVVDGSLRDRPYDTALRAVVKDTGSTRYLPDESSLYGLPVGWRSPIFLLPAGTSGGKVDRYSCYLRLHDAAHRAWNHGLVRLEAYDPDQLAPLAALALVERQGARSGDGRWDRHLKSVATTERVLRARRPSVFDF